jgi:hypothetical protein
VILLHNPPPITENIPFKQLFFPPAITLYPGPYDILKGAQYPGAKATS